MRCRNSTITTFLILGFAISLAGCQTTGSGSPQVTCEAIKFVYLSRKDTRETIRQVVANNGALIALCGEPRGWHK